MESNAAAISFDDLFDDVWKARTVGCARLRDVPLQALSAAASILFANRRGTGAIEAVLTEACERLDGPVGDAALALLGLAPGTRGDGLRDRQGAAALAYNFSWHGFRDKG